MIEVSNISKSYGKKDEFYALKNINMILAIGSFTVVKGVSGSGKSTLLSLIAGFARPSKGEIVVAGERISKLPENHVAYFRMRHIGFVFQSFALIEDMSVEWNIRAALMPRALGLKEESVAVDSALNLAHISHKKSEIARNLSGGEKQRCAIARALVNNPEIIIADEPTANLDKTGSQKFIEMLEELKGFGKTLIVATHDPLFETLSFVDNLVVLKEGEMVL